MSFADLSPCSTTGVPTVSPAVRDFDNDRGCRADAVVHLSTLQRLSKSQILRHTFSCASTKPSSCAPHVPLTGGPENKDSCVLELRVNAEDETACGDDREFEDTEA